MEGLSRDELWFRLMELGERTGCHQRADRSFFVGRYQMPLCARCTGVCIGQTAAAATLLFRRHPSPAVSVILLLIMGLDWSVQRIGLHESTNIRRLITGIMGGIGITFIWAAAIKTIIRAVNR